MTRLAVEGIEGFEVDEREARRAGWTYTIDTLDEFDRDEDLTLILGADATAGLATWERASEILERVVVAVAPRPGTDRAQVESAVPDPVWLDMPRLEVSGTEIRERAAAGRSFRFLVPDPVWRYVLEQGLYR
jgi:nicotinate-nucleotide adenylyltransferase